MGVRLGSLLAAPACALLAVASMPPVVASAAHPGVILVCADTPGIGCPADWDYRTIQEAVDHAKANDWILVWPGDYREHGNTSVDHSAGLWIDKSTGHGADGMFIRGMDRNLVMVDGTKSGPECSTDARDQNLGPLDPSNSNKPAGRDGVVVWKTEDVWLENFSACNFLTGVSGGHGNEIWWNGGDGSGTIGAHGYWGDRLTATSTYSNGNDDPRGQYGIFSSNTGDGKCKASANEPCYTGYMAYSYANNMADAAFYIGACPDCSQVLEYSHGQNSSLGFSGTNAGGDFIIKNTEFDQNKTGLTSNSQNNDDQPPPQSGLCHREQEHPFVVSAPGCTVFENNNIHDNNNPNVPGVGSGLSGGAPIGTGAVIAGDEFTTLYSNSVHDNGAWGILVTDLPDAEHAPPRDPDCKGGTPVGADPNFICWYQAFGNATINNVLTHNGSFGNPTNGDIGLIANVPPSDPTKPGNCFSGNTDPGAPGGQPTSDPLGVNANPLYACSTTAPDYQPNPNPGNQNPVLIAQANCASQLLAPCPNLPLANYPRQTQVHLMSLKETQQQSPTLGDPCGPDDFGEAPPPNPWCPYTGPSSVAKVVTPTPTPHGAVLAQNQPGLPQTGARISSSPSIPLTAAGLVAVPLFALALLGAARARRRHTVHLRRPPD